MHHASPPIYSNIRKNVGISKKPHSPRATASTLRPSQSQPTRILNFRPDSRQPIARVFLNDRRNKLVRSFPKKTPVNLAKPESATPG
jgi:hypothetical protein